MFESRSLFVATLALAGLASGSSAAYINAIDTANPFAHYRFSETSGTTIADADLDGVATVYNGTKGAGVTLNVAGPSELAGGFSGFESGNTAGQFAGSNSSNILLPNADPNNLGTLLDNGVKSGGTGLSAIFWVKPSTTGSRLALFGDRNANPLTQLVLNDNLDGTAASGGTVRFLVRGNTTAAAATRTAITSAGVVGTSGWSMIALTYQPSDQSVHIYVNGDDMPLTVAGSASPSTTAFAAASTLTAMGQTYTSTAGQHFYNGLMDEVSFFDRPLTSSEVQSLYNAAIPEPTALALLGLGAIGLLRRQR